MPIDRWLLRLEAAADAWVDRVIAEHRVLWGCDDVACALTNLDSSMFSLFDITEEEGADNERGPGNYDRNRSAT